MSLTGEFKLKAGKETIVLKASIKALYSSMRELECDNKLTNLLNMIDAMDIVAIYTLFKHFSSSDKDVEELMDLDIKLKPLTEAIAKALAYSIGEEKK